MANFGRLLLFLTFPSLSFAADMKCNSTTPPFGTFTDFFLPCQVVFYHQHQDANQSNSSTVNNSFTHPACWPSPRNPIIGVKNVSLWMWPDFCVGQEPRCYVLRQGRQLEGLPSDTLTKFRLQEPNHTTAIWLDCLADVEMAAKARRNNDDTFVSVESWGLDPYSIWNPINIVFVLGTCLTVGVCMYWCFRTCLGYFFDAMTGNDRTTSPQYSTPTTRLLSARHTLQATTYGAF